MRVAGWTTIVYAFVVLSGGMIGYFVAGSRASLLAGSISGILLFISGLGLLFRKKIALISSLALTLLIDAFFTYRFLLSFRFMPAGMMAIFTLLVLSIQVYNLWISEPLTRR